jgi:hypothetical protein
LEDIEDRGWRERQGGAQQRITYALPEKKCTSHGIFSEVLDSIKRLLAE